MKTSGLGSRISPKTQIDKIKAVGYMPGIDDYEDTAIDMDFYASAFEEDKKSLGELAKKYTQSDLKAMGVDTSTTDSKSSFRDRLAMSESSNNYLERRVNEDGSVYVGQLNFGQARLDDYMKANKVQFTQEQFRTNPALQDKVADWHFADIDRAINSLGNAATKYNMDGLRAVAHLGGITGMIRFVNSGGKINPSDELGTSLLKYYNKFSN
jgi:hypothetical protein